MADPNSSFLDQRKLAKILGVSVRSLERWRSSGDGPPFHKFGNRVLYDLPGDVRPWAEARRFGSTAEADSARDGRR